MVLVHTSRSADCGETNGTALAICQPKSRTLRLDRNTQDKLESEILQLLEQATKRVDTRILSGIQRHYGLHLRQNLGDHWFEHALTDLTFSQQNVTKLWRRTRTEWWLKVNRAYYNSWSRREVHLCGAGASSKRSRLMFTKETLFACHPSRRWKKDASCDATQM